MRNSTARSGLAPAIALFFLSPLVAEFLLGDFPLTWLPLMLVLAPMYGGGALLIREISIRWNTGWPGRFVLALAFGIIEEAYTTQSLFNPNYLGLHLLAYGWVPSLGIGLPWTVFVIGIHVIWSIATPIGLTEAIFPRRAGVRWLGPAGLVVVGLVFLGGCIILTRSQLTRDPFVARPDQLVASGFIVIALVLLGWRTGKTRPRQEIAGRAPAPLTVGVVALFAGSAFMGVSRLGAWMPAGTSVFIALGLLAGIAGLVWHWSGFAAWTALHRLALVVGAMSTYAWWGFYQKPVVPTSLLLDLASNAVFASGAAVLLGLALRQTQSD